MYFDFPLAVSFHHCSIIISILSSKLLLTEGQTGETWARYNKTDAFSEILVHEDTEIRPFFSVCWLILSHNPNSFRRFWRTYAFFKSSPFWDVTQR